MGVNYILDTSDAKISYRLISAHIFSTKAQSKISYAVMRFIYVKVLAS